MVAVQYFHALTEYLRERRSPYDAIVAFSGEHEFGGGNVTDRAARPCAAGKPAGKVKGRPPIAAHREAALDMPEAEFADLVLSRDERGRCAN